MPGAPSRERCLPAPQNSSHPRSKEGLLHSSCLKFLLNKSSGYRGIFQPGRCSQLSSPAGSRMRAGRKAVVPARRFLPAFPRVHCPGLCLPPCSHCSLCLAGCMITARLSNLLCKLTPPQQAEPAHGGGVCAWQWVSRPRALGQSSPSDPRNCPCHGDTPAAVPLLGCHHPAPALPGLKPQPCPALSCQAAPVAGEAAWCQLQPPRREATPCPPHQDGPSPACSKAALRGKEKEAGILIEPSISQH